MMFLLWLLSLLWSVAASLLLLLLWSLVRFLLLLSSFVVVDVVAV